MEATEISPRDTGKRFKFSRKGRRSYYRLQRVTKFLKFSNRMGEKANEMLEEVSEQEQEIKARLNGQYVSSDDQHRLDMIQKARQDNSLCVDSLALFSSQITRHIFHGEKNPKENYIRK